MVHDVIVSQVWPGDQPIAPGEFRDAQLLGSATGRPFQTAFGQDVHRGVFRKAAALFHSLIANHPFQNGNKRTAVLAVDLFLCANRYFLALDNNQMYKLAKFTASYREQDWKHDDVMTHIVTTLRGASIPFSKVRRSGTARMYKDLREIRRQIRNHELNRKQPGRAEG